MTGIEDAIEASYAIAVTVDRPFAQVLDATREALAAEGFGVLTEIDMQATLMAKIGYFFARQAFEAGGRDVAKMPPVDVDGDQTSWMLLKP